MMGDNFNWSYPSLDWSHFHSLANLLSLRNGGQVEASSLNDTTFEELDFNTDDDENDLASLNSALAQKISGSGHEKLKKKFLDCFAEFAANKKDGTAVACTAMKEAEDNVLIWVARNDGKLEADKPVFEKLAILLGLLSADDSKYEVPLWNELVSYQKTRIENSYIPDLRRSFKEYDTSIVDNTDNPMSSGVSNSNLSDLRSLIFDSGNQSQLERHKDLITACYNLRLTGELEELLVSQPNATSKSKKLYISICMVSRLRVIFQSFKSITVTLPSFRKVKILLVPRPPLRANPPQQIINLAQTFDILKVVLNSESIKAVLGNNWDVSKAKREFAKLQMKVPNVHAEVQLLIYLCADNEYSASGMFKYWGCSKLSCFLCNHLLRSYGRFTTRGCHGRLFKPWTVPDADRLHPGQGNRIAKALISAQRAVTKTLKASVHEHIKHERISVIGGSSIFAIENSQRDTQARSQQIQEHRWKSERQRVADIFRRELETDQNPRDQSFLAEPTCSPSPRYERECSVCGLPTRRSCSICGKGYYCSLSCQEKRSGSHLFSCSKRALTSADYLWRSLAADRMPEDEEVLQDFGFNNLINPSDCTYLLGLYEGLLYSDNITPEKLHEWRTGGILVDKIKEFYYKIPETHRGGYFPWFLKNLYVLDSEPLSKNEVVEKMATEFHKTASPYLEIEDRVERPQDLNLKPAAKRDSYFLLCEVLLKNTPNPIENHWFSFGFVACHNQSQEAILCMIYRLLFTNYDKNSLNEFRDQQSGSIQQATFKAFWKAYESGRLIRLMDSKGLENDRLQIPLLEEFLSATDCRPSVWDLKWCIEVNDMMNMPPTRSVRVDYGFVNCKTQEEFCILLEIYERLLQIVNPLELHRACIAGEIFQFASKQKNMFLKAEWQPLMRNPYPLP